MSDQNLNERVSYLEAQDKNIFHQLDEIKEDVRDIKRLTVAVERIALQTKSTSEQVVGINERLDNLEQAPVEEAKYYKRVILSCIITGVLSLILGAVLSLIIK